MEKTNGVKQFTVVYEEEFKTEKGVKDKMYEIK